MSRFKPRKRTEPQKNMEWTLKIELFDVDLLSVIRDKEKPPAGITVEGPIGTSLNKIDALAVTAYILVSIQIVGPVVAEIGKDVIKGLAKDWLLKFLAKHKARWIRIHGRDAKSKNEIERLIREEIDIGKND